jgi:multisubunit Na+/H+ antiporter MnhG subunit
MDMKGQVNVAGAAVAAIIGVIGIIIFASVYASLNTDTVSAGATSLLNLVDLLLAAVLVIGIVGVLAVFGMRR